MAKRRTRQDVTTLHIRNMVCDRCIRTVRHELTQLGFDVRSIALGEVVVDGVPAPPVVARIRTAMARNGFELIEDRRARVVDEIKRAAVLLARNDHEKTPVRVKDSEFIARAVGRPYHALSTLFSSVENITIERYLILQRIEYVKELLKYGDSTLSEIAYRLGYSSVQHLSSQFKTVTGMTPTRFKSLGAPHRHPIDHIGHTS